MKPPSSKQEETERFRVGPNLFFIGLRASYRQKDS